MEKIKNIEIFLALLFIIIGLVYYFYPSLCIKAKGERIGKIIEVKTSVPETMKKNNSKFAIIEIEIDGRSYSSKFIQVSMDSEVGDNVNVLFDVNNPNKMFLKNRFRKSAMFIAIGFIIIAYIIFKFRN